VEVINKIHQNTALTASNDAPIHISYLSLHCSLFLMQHTNIRCQLSSAPISVTSQSKSTDVTTICRYVDTSIRQRLPLSTSIVLMCIINI